MRPFADDLRRQVRPGTVFHWGREHEGEDWQRRHDGSPGGGGFGPPVSISRPPGEDNRDAPWAVGGLTAAATGRGASRPWPVRGHTGGAVTGPPHGSRPSDFHSSPSAASG